MGLLSLEGQIPAFGLMGRTNESTIRYGLLKLDDILNMNMEADRQYQETTPAQENGSRSSSSWD